MVGLEEEIIDKDFRQSYWLSLQFCVQPNRIFTVGVPQASHGIRKYNHEHANVSQQEHVFPSLQFMHVRLAPYGRRISKESLLLKKECYCRVLRTLWVRRCTNEGIGKDMNIIFDWLLPYVRRKKRFFRSCNRAVCVPRKGRIG